MKKIYLLLITLSFATVGFGQTIHCWDFNGATPPSNTSPLSTTNRVTGNGSITHTFSNVNANIGTASNACAGSVAGVAFSPFGSGNNGSSFILEFPTTCYTNISLSFAVQGTSSSYNDVDIAYSTNGTDFTDINTFNPRLNTSYTARSVNFSSLSLTNNNANFKVRFTLNGASGNASSRFTNFDNITLTGTPITTVPNNPQALSATAISSSQINLGYTGNGTDNTIIVFNTDNNFSTPSGPPPTVGTTFAGGTLLVNASGNGTYSHTGLNPETTYYYRAYSYNGCSYSSGFLSADATTPCAAPSTQATNFTATNINSPLIGNATLNWTRGDGTNVLVVMRANGAVNANPQSGTPYTANPAFGTGQQIGTGNFVVFNGPSTTSTVNVSNLVLGTTYHVAIYEYNSTGICYLTPALTGNFVVNVGITYLFVSGAWIPSDPNGVSSAADNISVLLGNAIINTNTLINNVTVNEFSALTVTSGTVLTVNGSLNMQSSNLKYSSLIVEGSITGVINYTRHVNINNGTGSTTGNNDLISAPLSGQSFGDFAGANFNIVSDPNNSNRKLFGPFNKSTGTYVIYDLASDSGVTLQAGLGYRAASTNNGGFVFTGNLETGDVSQAISNSGPQFKERNLVGNPYTSYINLAAFLAVNNSQFDSNASGVYGYDGMASDGYVIWNQAYADANPSAAMTPGQGFLVASKVGGGSIGFTPAMRTIGTTDDFIAGRSTGNISFLKLNATNGNLNYFTDFYFSDNASLNLDPGYDAAVFGYNAPEFAIYSHLVQGNTGKDMAIQSIGNSDLANEVIIPLGINAAQGQQVTISISESTISPDMNVYLEDTVNGSFTLLNTADYLFTANTTLNDTGRFFLRFSQSTLSSPEKNGSSLQIYATSRPRTLFVKGELTAATTITLYDTLGRQVLASNLNAGSTSNNVDVSSLSTGVYVVKLNNALQQKTQKVILK